MHLLYAVPFHLVLIIAIVNLFRFISLSYTHSTFACVFMCVCMRVCARMCVCVCLSFKDIYILSRPVSEATRLPSSPLPCERSN